MKKILSILLILFAFVASTEAQIFKKNMPVGEKFYTVEFSQMDTLSGKFVEMDLDFIDVKGVLDSYDFKSLDTSLKKEERILVYDPKMKNWRLPLSYNEAFGIPDKGQKQALQRLWITLGSVEPILRQKIK